MSFTSNLFAYFKFHSDWGRVTGKIEQNELDCRDTAPVVSYAAVFVSFYFHATRRQKKSYLGGYFLLLHSSCSLQPWLLDRLLFHQTKSEPINYLYISRVELKKFEQV